MPAGICPTSTDIYSNSCPTRFGSVERGDTTPRGCGLDLRSRLWTSRDGGVTGEVITDGLPDRTLAADSVVNENDV